MALDVAYSLMVDDHNGLVDRNEIHEKLGHHLFAPLASKDSEEMKAYERERWGLSEEAKRAAARMDEGDWIPTYNDPDDGAEEWRPGGDD